MNRGITVFRTLSEDGSIVTIIMMGDQALPIGAKETADALREYAAILETQDDVEMN